MADAADAPARLGFDTGYFIRLVARESQAVAAWHAVQSGEAIGLVSCLTLYELLRLGLKGAMPLSVAEGLLAKLPHVCDVLWLTTPDTFERAARVAHASGLSMADSLILVSFRDAGARVIYTTDADLARYPAGPEIIRL